MPVLQRFGPLLAGIAFGSLLVLLSQLLGGCEQ